MDSDIMEREGEGSRKHFFLNIEGDARSRFDGPNKKFEV